MAVNPYKMFDIYGLDQVKLYEGRILGTLPPLVLTFLHIVVLQNAHMYKNSLIANN